MSERLHIERLLALICIGASLIVLPLVLAEGEPTRARTSDGGCVMVDHSQSPATATPTTGCESSDPCVYVDWTTTPPTVATGSYC